MPYLGPFDGLTAGGGAIDWGGIISQGIRITPEIIGAAKGQPRYAYPYSYPEQPVYYPGRGATADGAQFGARYGSSSVFGNIDMSEVVKWGAIALIGLIVIKKALR